MLHRDTFIVSDASLENGRSVVQESHSASYSLFDALRIRSTKPYMKVCVSVPLEKFLGCRSYGCAMESRSLRHFVASEAFGFVKYHTPLGSLLKDVVFTRAFVAYHTDVRRFLVYLICSVKYFQL